MLTYTYFGKDDFRLCEKPVPELKCDTDALVKVTLSSICTSDLHIMHGYVPRAETEEFDGTGKPYNPGGTCHFLNLAHGKGLEDCKDIHIIRDELPCAARKNSGRK